MEPIREQWYQVSQKWAEWTASMRNEEPKNYSELILNLPPVSVKDQTVLLRIRANGLMLSVGGGVAAAMTGFWASSSTFCFHNFVLQFSCLTNVFSLYRLSCWMAKAKTTNNFPCWMAWKHSRLKTSKFCKP